MDWVIDRSLSIQHNITQFNQHEDVHAITAISFLCGVVCCALLCRASFISKRAKAFVKHAGSVQFGSTLSLSTVVTYAAARLFETSIHLILLHWGCAMPGAIRKARIDAVLVSRGIAADRKAAAAMILAGDIFVRQDQRMTSPAAMVADDIILRVRSRKEHPWVSRGGSKLQHAIQEFQLQSQVQGSIAIDVGCSTGGFTDVLLHHDAKTVYAVDV
eukprot:6449-Heterococcus_DN1.PRE.2